MTIDDLVVTSSPVLSDGKTFDDLIDVAYREVDLRVLTDPEIYRLELDRLFARAWTVLAHEDEIPNPGDFVLRYVGQDEVIVSRAADGAISAVLNVCTHRAAKLCRFDAGNSNRFTCAYHGWAFRPDGKFLGSPIPREKMHGELRSKDELGLLEARVDTSWGMVFATFDPEAPSLRDYIGPMAWYWDMMFGRTHNGITVLGAPQRFTIRANWKCAAEQFAGDIFHTLNLHKSMQELELLSTDGPVQEPAMAGLSASHNGHFVRLFDLAEDHYINALKGQSLKDLDAAERLRLSPPPGMNADMVDDLFERFEPDRLKILAEQPPQVGQLFPNVGALAMPFPMPDGSVSAFFTWRAWVPKGPEEFELFSWTVVERDAPQELRDQMRLMTAATFGTSGFVEVDDTDTWPAQTKASRGALGRKQKLRYQAIRGEVKPSGFPGPGQVYDGFARDDTQWEFWIEYLKYMTGRPW
jgi:phenylpropionate dioxygenase-like ring-hydroxylating dioxygenase large terminal subunit